MFKLHVHRSAVIAFVAAAPLAFAAAALAVGPPPEHTGDPALWGPPLETLCDDPALAASEGYNVILDPLANGTNLSLVGTAAADAIYAFGGNDKVWAGPGDDLVCGGFGHDSIKGEQGADAIFGEVHDDTLKGDKRRDFLDGGGQNDSCDGGLDADASVDCETVVSVP